MYHRNVAKYNHQILSLNPLLVRFPPFAIQRPLYFWPLKTAFSLTLSVAAPLAGTKPSGHALSPSISSRQARMALFLCISRKGFGSSLFMSAKVWLGLGLGLGFGI